MATKKYKAPPKRSGFAKTKALRSLCFFSAQLILNCVAIPPEEWTGIKLKVV